MDNAKVVTAFCQAWSRMDPHELAGYFTQDAVYHNIPMEPLVGLEAIHNALHGMADQLKDVQFEIRRQLADGDVVMNERIDRMTIQGRKIELPVVGVFEMQDGKIKAWRDYFDRGMSQGG
ncbi:MAG: limonene-1,2-epoxide hydrolase family protein [Dehalococcoidia bacterium]